MKNLILVACALLTLQLTAGVLRAQAPAQTDSHGLHKSAAIKAGEEASKPASPALSALEKLKLLAGDWEARDGKSYGGKPIRVSYKVVSNGTGVMETYYQVGSDFIDMVTVYHLDGDSLMMTHFCAVNNQVRLRAEPLTADAKALSFNYIDATNLSVSHKDVMTKLEMSLPDNEHFTQTWTWRMTDDKGKKYDEKAVYSFVRRK